MATPALHTLKVIAEHSIGGKSIMEFMGPNNQSPDAGETLQMRVRPMLRMSGSRG